MSSRSSFAARPSISSVKSSITSNGNLNQGLMRNPVFNQAVQRAAWGMLQGALRSGKLRVNHQTPAGAFVPRMVLLEDGSSNKLTAIFELPGVKTSDITLQIRGGNLIVAGERKPPQPLQLAVASSTTLPRNPVTAADNMSAGDLMDAESFNVPSTHISIHELRFGTFHRSIPVPEGLKESDVTAALQDGLLTVTWPRITDRANQNAALPIPGALTAAQAAQ